jgi:hypothetical protein
LEVKTESEKISLIPINKKLIKFYDMDNRKLYLKEIEGILSLWLIIIFWLYFQI